MKNASFVFCGSKGTHRGICQVPDDYFDTEELFIGRLGVTYRHEPIEELIKLYSPDQRFSEISYWNIEPLN
jgi:hypothetical protein